MCSVSAFVHVCLCVFMCVCVRRVLRWNDYFHLQARCKIEERPPCLKSASSGGERTKEKIQQTQVRLNGGGPFHKTARKRMVMMVALAATLEVTRWEEIVVLLNPIGHVTSKSLTKHTPPVNTHDLVIGTTPSHRQCHLPMPINSEQSPSNLQNAHG